MNRMTFSTIVCCVFFALLAGCAGMQGPAVLDENVSIPGTSSNVVDVGNPTEEPEMPKALYVNERYGVGVEYPAAWTFDEPNPAEANFSTDEGVALTISFVDLEEGESFESFLTELRGGFDDLHELATAEFDRALHRFGLSTVDGNRFFDIERYYLEDQAPQRFVMIQSGLIDSDIVTSKMDQTVLRGTIKIEKPLVRIKGPIFVQIDDEL